MTNGNDRVLHLTIKKKWFDMIASGEKKEEYREIKGYWISRLSHTPLVHFFEFSPNVDFMTYDYVKFTNGYGKNAPSLLIECKGISIGNAKPEWSDNWQGEVFIISLGDLITALNDGVTPPNDKNQ